MQRVVVGFLVAWSLVVAVGCESKCRNPKIHRELGGLEGPAIQCNVVIMCPNQAGRPDSVERLEGLVDPVIRDHGSGNRDLCKGAAMKIRPYEKQIKCEFDAAPALICLDGAGSSNGPDYTGPTGGTLVTVGVGAGTGDYWFDEDEEGAGGEGGFDAHPGEGGHGGI
ncbi:hypothetical protein [Polyangium mundeleinium]|uniref:Lipoprotein n=1 Tax=Polyangium mundeleinium TaxID=2995306 RepID=A0ABT5EKM2_9BACT|nr:hypothetical protein [Polyangium mundeleinium]MDC0741266.1 hypothetical protein [Polyangium mundeleinium]